MEAKKYYSGFDLAHDAYNAVSSAGDGKIYYILSSPSLDKGGQVYSYDPVTDSIEFLADLTEVCGEEKGKFIPQGKTHAEFYEKDGKLYFSSHIGFYETVNGIERMPVTQPKGFRLYPGGHILSYDLSTKKFKDLAVIPGGEGIITMTMDQQRGHIYAISWPNGNFIHYNVETKELKNIGPVSGRGESGVPGKDFSVLCRSMVVDPGNGAVYFSTSEGNIYFYKPCSASIGKVDSVSLRLDYFGTYDPTRPGSMGYNWRKIIWYPSEEVAYGVHGPSGYLFRFDPRDSKIELVERLTSEPSKRSGMYDLFAYGYLGLQLGPDNKTLYYLTGGPIEHNRALLNGEFNSAMKGTKTHENLHLVTYSIPEAKYMDHGPVYYTDGTGLGYANSIAIDRDGNIYTIARSHHDGNTIADLVKIQNPFSNSKPLQSIEEKSLIPIHK